MNDGTDIFSKDDLLDGSSVDDVQEAEGSLEAISGGFSDVSGNDVRLAVSLAELNDEVRTDLAVGASDENTTLSEVIRLLAERREDQRRSGSSSLLLNGISKEGSSQHSNFVFEIF